jgi:hypothetical protein
VNKPKYFGIIILTALCLFTYTIKAEEYKKEYKVEPGQELRLDLETGTRIEIAGWDKNVVDIYLEVSGRDSDLFEVEFEQTNNGVEVNTDYEYHHRDVKCKSVIKVKVPNKFDLDFSTLGGSVSIDGVEGTIEGTTMGGEYDLRNLKGELDCETMGGEISLVDSEVDGKVKTMGGRVKLENIVGDVDATTMGGSIIQKNVKSKSGNRSAQNVSTMGGDVEISEASNGAYAKTMGGNIKVEYVKDFLEAETMGGSIKVKQLDGRIKATTMGGEIEVVMVGNPEEGDRNVYLKSMGGDIELVVPESLSMDIDVEIEWTRHSSEPEIITDFGVESKISNNDGRRKHNRYVTGRKIVNGGKNRIKIRTVNSDVRILKK